MAFFLEDECLGGHAITSERGEELKALIDWSFELCSPSEQLLWARLSVVADAFDIHAAEQVCGDGEISAEEVLDLVAGLDDQFQGFSGRRRSVIVCGYCRLPSCARSRLPWRAGAGRRG